MSSSSSDKASANRRHETVLLVHESEAVLALLRKHASRFCSIKKLLEARSASEAYGLFSSENPSLVIASVSLPDMSGFDLLRSLKHANPNCVVGLVSSQNHRIIRIAGLALGAAAIVCSMGEEAEIQFLMKRLLEDRPPSESPSPREF